MLLKHKFSCALTSGSAFFRIMWVVLETNMRPSEQLTCESDVAEDTMSAMVKLAKDPLEPHDIGQPTSECLLMAFLLEKTGYTQRRAPAASWRQRTVQHLRARVPTVSPRSTFDKSYCFVGDLRCEQSHPREGNLGFETGTELSPRKSRSAAMADEATTLERQVAKQPRLLSNRSISTKA